METVKLDGAVPLAVVTPSHPPGLLAAVAVKLALVAFETVTGMLCALGVAEPATYAKLKLVVDTAMAGDPAIVSVTGTVMAVPPAGVTVICPLYIPPAKPVVVTETVMALTGVVYCIPAEVLNEIQLPPLVVVADTVKAAELCPAGLVTEIYCDETLAPSDAAVKVKLGDVDEPPFAVTEMVLPLLLVVPTAKLTWTLCVTPFASNEMAPE
jgi:hypothetical protein